MSIVSQEATPIEVTQLRICTYVGVLEIDLVLKAVPNENNLSGL
jgi:hypothetical protein